MKSDVCQLKELIESIKLSLIWIILALDPFKIPINETNPLNLPDGNTAVIPCELPNGNPRPIPVFTLNDQPLDVESKSSMK